MQRCERVESIFPVDAGNYRRYTPLHIAAGMGAFQVVAVDAGAIAGARTTFGETPLHRLA
jgi:ankyrin repeat protein